MNILLSSAGRCNYLVGFFQRALAGRGKVFVTDASRNGAGHGRGGPGISRPAGEISPLFRHPAGHLRGKPRRSAPFLNDLELPGLARRKERFLQAGVTAVVSSPEAIDVCLDKVRTAGVSCRVGNFNSPNVHVAGRRPAWPWPPGKSASPWLSRPAGGPAPSGWNSSRTMRNWNSPIASSRRRSAGHSWPIWPMRPQSACVVIQPRIAGKEFHLDVVNDLHGRWRATLCKEKIAMRAGETDKAMTVHNVDSRNSAPGSAGLGHMGNLDVESSPAPTAIT